MARPSTPFRWWQIRFFPTTTPSRLPGPAVEIDGTLGLQGKGQSVEVVASAVTVLGEVDDPATYPVAKKGHTFEYLRTVAHLRPRTNTFGALARVRATLAQAIHGYFADQGFLWVNTPLITASDCEGAENFSGSAPSMPNPPRTARAR